LNILLLFCR